MINDNSVVFKGKKNGIVILLNEEIPFSELKEIFKNKVLQAKNFFGKTKTSIAFQGRFLTNDEEQMLIEIISRESGLDISFVDDVIQADPYTESEMLLNSTIDSLENSTQYHKGSIRSGQSISYKGSIVVIGDVNPGGEVIAEGNIVILGSLKGLAHAGCSGNTDCFVSAFLMNPTQLRISNIITYIPKEIANKNKIKIDPSIAYAKDGQIYIEPLL